jgi:hypothetical protein
MQARRLNHGKWVLAMTTRRGCQPGVLQVPARSRAGRVDQLLARAPWHG